MQSPPVPLVLISTLMQNVLFNSIVAFSHLLITKHFVWDVLHDIVMPCMSNVVFRDGDNFCKAFAGAQVNLSYHEWRSNDFL